MINTKIATILGMELPEETVTASEMIKVEPHDLYYSDNADLPSMTDIERRQNQAEKELQEVIDFSLGYQRELFDQVASVEPKFRSRYVEVANGTLGLALDAIKIKLKTQDEKRKQRLKEAEFRVPGKSSEPKTTNNFFMGTREELLAAIKNETDDQK